MVEVKIGLGLRRPKGPRSPRTKSTRLNISPPTATTRRLRPKSATTNKKSSPTTLRNLESSWLVSHPNPQSFLRYLSSKLNYYKSTNAKFTQLLQQIGEAQSDGSSFLASATKSHELEVRLQKSQDALARATRQITDERQNYISLLQTNTLLQTQLSDYKHKFQVVLLLSGVSEQDVQDYVQNHPNSATLTDEMMKIRQEIQQVSGAKESTEILNPLILWKQKKTLESQLKEQAEFYESKLHSLHQDLQVVQEERTLRVEQANSRIKALADKLRTQNELLHTLLLQHVQAQKVQLQSEQTWAQERTSLLDMISVETLENEGAGLWGEQVPASTFHHSKRSKSTEMIQKLEQELLRTQNKVLESQTLLQTYEWKILKLQKSLESSHSQSNLFKSQFNSTVRKLMEKNQLLESRLVDWESKRKLDVQGYFQDLSKLRKFLHCLQQKIKEGEVELSRRKLCPCPTSNPSSKHSNPDPPRSKSAPVPVVVVNSQRKSQNVPRPNLSDEDFSFPHEIYELLQVASAKLSSLEKKYGKI